MLIKNKSVTVNHRPENTNKQSAFFLFSMSVYTVFKTEKKGNCYKSHTHETSINLVTSRNVEAADSIVNKITE